MKSISTLFIFLLTVGVSLGQVPLKEVPADSPLGEAVNDLPSPEKPEVSNRATHTAQWRGQSRVADRVRPVAKRSTARNSKPFRFDSVVVQLIQGNDRQNNLKEEFYYNANEQLTEEAQFEWVNNAWQGLERLLFGYDTNGNQNEVIIFIWNSNTADWVPFERNATDFNSENLPVRDTSYSWDPIGSVWIPQSSVEISYNATGQQTVALFSNWDPGSDMFVPDLQLLSTYDDEDMLLTFTFNTRDSATGEFVTEAQDTIVRNEDGTEVVITTRLNVQGNLFDAFRTTDRFDDNGNLIESFTEIFTGLAWLPESRNTSTYNEDNLLLTDTSFFWDGSGWVPNLANVNTYNANGYVEENSVSQLADTMTQTLAVVFRADYEYDQLGNPTREEYFSFNANTQQLENDVNYIYAHDTDVPVTDILAPDFFLFLLNPDFSQQTVSQPLTETVAFPDGQGNDIPAVEATYYYSDQVTSTRQVFDLEAEIFPNPAEDILTIDWETAGKPGFFELYDLQGRRVMEQQLYGRTQLPVAQFPAGIYLYRLKEADRYASGKIVIK